MQTFAIGLHHTQGDALGYVLVAPSGRALNACAYSLIQLEKLEMLIFLAPTYQNHRHLAKEIPLSQGCPRMSKNVQECPRLKRGYKNSCSYLIRIVVLAP